jgi:hypothetical protein
MSASREIKYILWNCNIGYRVHKSPPFGPILSYINPNYIFNIHFNIILPSTLRSSKWFLSLGFPYQNPTCTSSVLICGSSLAPFLRLAVITQIIFGESYNSFSSSLYSLLKLSCYIVGQIPSSAQYSKTRWACVLPTVWKAKFHTHVQRQAKSGSV